RRPSHRGPPTFPYTTLFRSRLLADREHHSENLRNAAMGAQKIEAELRAQLADAQDRHRVAIETLRTEKSLIENELKRSQEERFLDRKSTRLNSSHEWISYAV